MKREHIKIMSEMCDIETNLRTSCIVPKNQMYPRNVQVMSTKGDREKRQGHEKEDG